MDFWKKAYDYGWADDEQLKLVVTTKDNPNGEIKPEEYKEITGKNFKE